MSSMAWLYRSVGRVLYVVVRPLAALLIKDSERTRVFIVHNDELLLTQDWLGNGFWSLPGGGFKKGETAKECAKREVAEELSVVMLDEHLQFFARKVFVGKRDARYNASVFVYNGGRVVTRIDNKEIIAAQWFRIDALPKKTSKLIGDMIREGALDNTLTRG